MPSAQLECVADLDQIHMLVRSYLESTHVLWPTFHLQPFLTSLASAKTSNDPVFICLVLAIAFVTLRSKRTRKDLSEETGIIFYHSCESVLSTS